MLVKANITFDGQAEEALTFYKRVFNGTIANLMRYGEVADKYPDGMVTEEYESRIVNARLDFGNNMFNVCDSMPTDKLIVGNNIAMDLVFFEGEDIQAIFEALSVAGEVFMQLEATYFSPNFGIVKDQFGINWTIMQMYK